MNALPSKRPLLLALALTVGLSANAAAQISYDAMTTERWAAVEHQLVTSLASPYEGVRAQNAKNAIYFATFYRDRLDLRRAVKSLITTCEDEGREAEHVVALAALQAIGGAEAHGYLAARVAGEQADAVRRAMMAVLSGYYPTAQAVL